MTVDTCFQLISYCVNKYQGSQPSPEEFNLIINQAQLSYAQWLCGQYETYQPQKAQSRVSWGQNENVRESLTPIIYGYILNADITGLAAYPYDYQKMDAMTTIYGYNRIRFASQNRLFSYINSAIEPVATNPIYLVKDIGFQFYPVNIGQANLSYVRTPPDIVWRYTLDADDLPVYNPATSVDPVWADLDILEISVRALRLVGVNLQSNVLSQYADQIKNAGQ
jgi:hypothetical protein